MVKDLQTENILMNGSRYGNVYRLMANKDMKNAPVFLLMNKEDGDLWHAHLGHPFFDVLCHVAPSISLSSSLNKIYVGTVRWVKLLNSNLLGVNLILLLSFIHYTVMFGVPLLSFQ